MKALVIAPERFGGFGKKKAEPEEDMEETEDEPTEDRSEDLGKEAAKAILSAVKMNDAKGLASALSAFLDSCS